MRRRYPAWLCAVFAAACLSFVAGPAAAEESDSDEQEIALEGIPTDDDSDSESDDGAPTLLELLASEEAALLLEAGLDPAIAGAAGQLHVDRSVTQTQAGTRGAEAATSVRLAAPKPQLTLRYRTQISVYDRTDTPASAHRPPRVNAKRRKMLGNRFARVTPQVTKCYGQPLRGEEPQRHRVVASVIVDRKGAVIAAQILHNTRETDFEAEACIRQVLSGLSFPRRLGRGPVELVYPWTFVFRDP